MNRPPVYLVGAGPGAADLLTLRAARLLSQADIVFYDALVQPEVIALAEKAVKISVGKRCGKHSSAQRFIHKRLIDAAHAGQTVVRLKGGDPMLFGRAQEEIDALSKAGIDVEVVPGVSAAFATSARLGISHDGLRAHMPHGPRARGWLRWGHDCGFETAVGGPFQKGAGCRRPEAAEREWSRTGAAGA